MGMKIRKGFRRFLFRATAVLGIAGGSIFCFTGCATNPVTGKNELSLISESQEVQIGEANYGPTIQTEGGPYATMPELTAYVNEVGQKLVAVSDRPDLPYEFEVLNNPVPNAWALPGGKIAINRGLLAVLESEAELAAVLGHEIVHAAARHSAQRMERQTLGNAITTAAVIGIGAAMGDDRNRDLVMGAAHTSAVFGSQLIYSKYSRDAESEADYYGMHYLSKAGYDPRAAVSLQEKFVELSQGNNPGWLDGLFLSHPPSPQRVERNRQTLAELPEGGFMGEAEYRERLRPLIAAQAAYDRYQEAGKAYAAGEVDRSLELLNEAASMLPGEGLIDAMKARLHSQKGDADAALNAIREAIRKNPEYFAFHMIEGQLLSEMGRNEQARFAFQRSNQLLPTAESQAALGFLALEAGDAEQAYRFLSDAARFAETKAGQASRQALLPLEMKRDPSAFISARPVLTRDGQLEVEVSNRGPYPYELIVLEVVTADGGRRELAVSEPIRNGQTLTLKTPFGPYNSTADPLTLARIQLVRAILDV